MLHKLLKQRRLGHLKVGARTLISREHLEQFREASKVPSPVTSPEQNPDDDSTEFIGPPAAPDQHAGGRLGGLGGVP
jgi:hypothetical protein